MAADSTFAPNWTKLIARAWVDPQFRSTFEADPSKVMGDYGIHAIGGKDVSELTGKIQVVDHPVAGHDRPFMSGETLVIPFPAPPQEYDTVVDPDTVAVAGAGNPHANWATINGGVGTVWTEVVRPSGAPSTKGVETGQGPNDSLTPGGAPKSQQKQSVPSIPSVSYDGDDDDGGGEAAGEGAGADTGADAGAAAGEAAGGADAAADASAAAAFLCA